MIRHLALLRHAKSSWDDPHLADHDRPLNKRGRGAAARMAGLYGAPSGELLARLREVEGSVASVLLIGHNPGIQELAIGLSGDEERLASFPTAALADLRNAAASWGELGPGTAALHALAIPRELD